MLKEAEKHMKKRTGGKRKSPGWETENERKRKMKKERKREKILKKPRRDWDFRKGGVRLRPPPFRSSGRGSLTGRAEMW
jgi:hypothetical protein